MNYRTIFAAAFGAVFAFGLKGVENIPVLAECDVVVAGGTSCGVAAAVAAKASGARVFLVAQRPYLGDDLAGKLRLAKEAGDDFSMPLAKAAYTLRGKPIHKFGDTTPLHLKKTFDEAMLAAKVPFLAWTAPCRVLRDAEGKVAGILAANVNGLHIVKARAVIDATERGTLARSAGAEFREMPAGEQKFTRYVIAGDAPKVGAVDGAGVVESVEAVGGEQAIDARGKGQLAPAADAPSVVTARLWKCALRIPMKDGSGRELAAAEQKGRDLTWTRTQVDAGDTMVFEGRDGMVKGVEGVWVCGAGGGAPGAGIARAAAIGAEAGKAAKGMKSGEPVYKGDLPVLAECDVVVAGGGTGGAPAAIAASRKGMRTILCEFSHRLGGVMTDGGIGLYCYGLQVGFTAELDAAVKNMGSVYGVCKAEWFRQEMRRHGTEVWFGAMVTGVRKEGAKLTAVEVAMADGTLGLVKCRAAIDATGNAVLAEKAGEETEFINAEELSLQGAGSTPRILGKSYQNTDTQFVDDTDAADLSYFWLRARTSFGTHVWDQAQVVNSRERRRMVGEFYVTVQDAMGGRTYPDVIGLTRSNFDTHGQTMDTQFFIEDPGHDAKTVYLPYRCILPRKTDGLLVTGLGMSAHRDAMPILRMQPDVQNQGYAAGLAAAMAVKSGKELRAIDVKELQRQLVEMKIVPEKVLTMEDNFPLSDEELAAAVKELADKYKGLARVLTDAKRAYPLLVRAFGDPPGDKSADARLKYAHVLGLLGDARGAKELAAKLDSMKWDKGWNYRGMHQFGRSVSWADSYLIALGRAKAKEGFEAAMRKAGELTAAHEYSHFRAVALALEGIGDKSAAPLLAELLLKPGIGGHYLAADAVPKIEGYEQNISHLGIGDKERSDCLRELCLARALYRLGDHGGLGRKTLRRYADDPRRAYANHAIKVLEK